MVTVYFSDHKCNVPVEIQLRTIAMEFWATLEHQLRYKKNGNRIESMQKQLKQCAELVTTADYKMQQLADQWLYPFGHTAIQAPAEQAFSLR